MHGLGRKPARYDPSEGYRFFDVDHLGSTRRMERDESSATMRVDYFPYGEVLTQAGTDETPYTFTGKELDAAMGLQYFGARYYDSRIGRWLVVDPFSHLQPSWSPYHYSYNRPVGFSDPDGRLPVNRLDVFEKDDYDSDVRFWAMQGWTPDYWASGQGDDGDENTKKKKDVSSFTVGVVGFASTLIFFSELSSSGVGTLILLGTAVVSGVSVGVLVNAMNESNADEGADLSKQEKKILGNLVKDANKTGREVAKQRGASGKNIKKLGHWADKTLKEIAKGVTNGEKGADAAIKIIKQALEKSQKFKGK